MIWGFGFVVVCLRGFGCECVITKFFFPCCYIEFRFPINGKQRYHLKYHINRNYFYLELRHNGAFGTQLQITVMEIYPFWVGNSFTAGEGHQKREELCAVLSSEWNRWKIHLTEYVNLQDSEWDFTASTCRSIEEKASATVFWNKKQSLDFVRVEE